MVISKEYATDKVLFRNGVNPCPAKYSCGWRRPRADHGFWPCKSHPELRFACNNRRPRSRRAMDCARDPERGGVTQQRGRHFLFRDGHDRSASQTGRSYLALAYHHPGSPQVFTGAVPFNHSIPAAAIIAIMGGRRPPRPTHPTFTHDLWTLMQRCWDQDPHLRPETSWVVKALSGK